MNISNSEIYTKSRLNKKLSSADKKTLENNIFLLIDNISRKDECANLYLVMFYDDIQSINTLSVSDVIDFNFYIDLGMKVDTYFKYKMEKYFVKANEIYGNKDY